MQGSRQKFHSCSRAEEMHLLRLPRKEPCFSQPWGFSSPPFHCQFTSTLLCRKIRIFYIRQGYSQVTFVPCLPITALETEREKCVRTHRGGTVKARYHFSRWKTGVHPCIYQPVSKHLPPGWVFFCLFLNFRTRVLTPPLPIVKLLGANPTSKEQTPTLEENPKNHKWKKNKVTSAPQPSG